MEVGWRPLPITVYTEWQVFILYSIQRRVFLIFHRLLRHLAIVGLKGHVATFDWQTGTLHSELQLRETCRDITFVHQKLTLRFG